MSEQGWISIHRKIRDSWIWNDKPYDRTHAWLDILLSANHQDKKIMFDSNLYEVERGSFITSIRKLCERWGWSNTKVKRFLDALKDDEMITYKSDTKKTTITVVKYEVYQDLNITRNDTETSQKHHRNDTETSQKHTNNNDNNDNNDNKYMSDSNEYRLAVFLFNHIKQNNEKAKEPNYQKWAKHFDYILRLDKRDLEEVKKVIMFCQKDSFWMLNILSPEKLRDKYDRLLLQMNEPKKNNSGKKDSSFNNFKQREYDFNDLEKKLVQYHDDEDLKEANCSECVVYINNKCFLKKKPDKNNMCSSFKKKGE